MKALHIDASKGVINEIEIEMQANTLYTFFSSLLIDELFTINGHVVYSDANALSEKKAAYFIGEQLVLGDALIVARDALDDRDATIKKEELRGLIVNELSEFYQSALQLLSLTDINIYRTFEVIKDGNPIELSSEWTLYTFNIADIATRKYFLDELEKKVAAKEDVMKFMQKISQLAVNAIQ